MDPTLLDTFAAYGGAAQQRSGGAIAAAKAGAVGVVVRSLTLQRDDDPHTGTMSYEPATREDPGGHDLDEGRRAFERVPARGADLKFRFKTSSQMLPPVVSHNVMGGIARIRAARGGHRGRRATWTAGT